MDTVPLSKYHSSSCSGQIWKSPCHVFFSHTPYLIYQYILLTLLQTTPLNQTFLNASATTTPARWHQPIIPRLDYTASPTLLPASAFAFCSSFHTVSTRSFENMSNQVVPMLKTPVASHPSHRKAQCALLVACWGLRDPAHANLHPVPID